MYLKLGLNHKVHIRQDLVGANYGLLTDNFPFGCSDTSASCGDAQDDVYEVLPDYWATWLWKKLMGTGVINATVSGAREIRSYAHCTLDRPTAATILIINVDEVERNVTLPPAVGGEYELWRTTAPGGDITSTRVNLNGAMLRVSPEGSPPPFPAGVGFNSQLTIAPHTYAFVVVPGAAVAECDAPLKTDDQHVAPANGGRRGRAQIPLARVAQFATQPEPFVLMDWRSRTAQLDAFILGAAARESGFTWWTGANPTPLLPAGSTTMAIASYANATSFKPGSSEGLPVMGSVLGAAVARVGVRNVTRAEAATLKYLSPVGIFRDFPDALTGGSFWYDVAPSIFATSLSDLFPESAKLRNLTRHSIGKWVSAAQKMQYNFTHTAFSFETSSPVNNGKWVEADAAAGIGWLSFMGSRLGSSAESPEQLDCARKSIGALEKMAWNPLYEMQLPFGALIAARLNAEEQGSVDVHKLLSWSFTPDEPTGNHLPGAPTGVTRSGWGAVAGRWGDKTIDGLIGSSLDGDGYAFFGNTAWFFAALSPLPRYDYRFADALGKWMTAVAVNARYFYPDQLGERQSGPINWGKDPDSVIPYEGLRKCDWSRPAGKCLTGPDWGPFGTGQNCGDAGVAAGSGKCRPVPTIPYQVSTDRGFYGGMYIGLIGGAVYATNHSNVLQFDLCANDRFAPASFPTALLYNPTASPQLVTMNTTAAQRAFGGRAVDIYESTTDTVILKDTALTSGDVVVEVPARQAIIVVAIPAHSALVRALNGQVSVSDKSTGKSIVVRFRVPTKHG